MTPTEIAESVKRLRDIYACHGGADPHELMAVVEALVQLVGEMEGELAKVNRLIEYQDGDIILKGSATHDGIVETLIKAAPIAALAKEAK